LFALDITNPSRFKEANADKIVMWEFTNKDAPNLGYTYSRPVIALANNGRWVAIFGSGYNDSGDGKAKLFIVDIEKGMDGWDDGDYIEISTGAGTSSKRNGLASPALVDTDGNGTVDRIYAGDLEGNMWAFDVSSDSTSRWKVAFGSTATPQPLFKTESGQAITAKPIITKHPTMPLDVDSNAPNLMVYFGTGQYLVNGDKSSTGTQSFYGVWDKGANSDSGSSPLTRAALVEQTVSTKGGVRLISRNAVDYSEDLGWWFDLPDSGERSVTNAVARRDVVFFNTFVPTNDPCSTGGYGWKFVADMATGGSPLAAVTDYNKDGVVDEGDLFDDGGPSVKQDGFLSEPVFVEEISFTGDKPTKVVPLPYLPSGRFSWQELIR
jgi:type IV pilus assembly protein PilY1